MRNLLNGVYEVVTLISTMAFWALVGPVFLGLVEPMSDQLDRAMRLIAFFTALVSAWTVAFAAGLWAVGRLFPTAGEQPREEDW